MIKENYFEYCPILIDLIGIALPLQEIAEEYKYKVDNAVNSDTNSDRMEILFLRESELNRSLSNVQFNIKLLVQQCGKNPECRRCNLREHFQGLSNNS